ncbi:hypothetical protein BaRGS_00013974 [Batillaria attramentaria]|uniref:G-protein coupled receptors family 1 profile domain-containing protein n=1 Tax=Batillaria attramentaria TaxID=370345 RepID=A0ABD0L6S9_9CAEN
MSYTVISIDRYVYISRPYFYQRAITPRRVVGSVLTMWGAATGLAVVMCALKNADENVVCSRSTASKTDAYIVGPVYFTCSAVSGIMYALISRIALQQLKRTGPSQTTDCRHR